MYPKEIRYFPCGPYPYPLVLLPVSGFPQQDQGSAGAIEFTAQGILKMQLLTNRITHEAFDACLCALHRS
jgi:hypothetical protein